VIQREDWSKLRRLVETKQLLLKEKEFKFISNSFLLKRGGHAVSSRGSAACGRLVLTVIFTMYK